MSSPCAVLFLSVCTPHSTPKFIDRQGQGQGQPMERPNEHRRVFPRPTAALGRRRRAARSMDVNVRRTLLKVVPICLMSRLDFCSPSTGLESDIDRPPLDAR